jgi:HD-like signal output (HDOD) protein
MLDSGAVRLEASMQKYPSLVEVVHTLAELRPLGATASQVLRLTADGRFSAHELASTIASDQALTAKTLRLANSAYYGFPRRITTVRDAVVLLGFRAVRAATVATCLVDAIPGSNTLDYTAFWHYSLAVGSTAELLSRAEATGQDEAFTAGVLHNIGRLALDQFVPAGFAESVYRAREHQLTLPDAERAVLGYTDAELGGALAEHWNFPAPLVEAVRNHALDAHSLPDPGTLTACVVRARLFVRSYGLPDGLEHTEPYDRPAEWSTPPLSVALDRGGGFEGLLNRVDAFMDSSVPS